MSTAVYPVTPENFYLLKAIRDANPEMNVNTAVIPGAYSRECRPDNGFSACHKLSELPEEVDTVFFLSCPNTEKLLKRDMSICQTTRFTTISFLLVINY